MKHVAYYLLGIAEQQKLLQIRQNELEALFNSLSDSSSIATIATLPKCETDLAGLKALVGELVFRISQVKNAPIARRELSPEG